MQKRCAIIKATRCFPLLAGTEVTNGPLEPGPFAAHVLVSALHTGSAVAKAWEIASGALLSALTVIRPRKSEDKSASQQWGFRRFYYF